jgi:hypothetical protein
LRGHCVGIARSPQAGRGANLRSGKLSYQKEEAKFGEGHTDSIVQRGIDEALSCQDMLERTPVKPSLFFWRRHGWTRLPVRLFVAGWQVSTG